MNLTLTTPERTILDGPADFVAVTLFDGELGIAPGHAPLVGRLGYGELRVTRDKEVVRYYVEGGFVETVGDAVSILTSRAVPAGELDEAVAEEQLAAALARPATSPEAQAARQRTIAQSRAQLRIARRDKE